jgi:hypothetical protein
MANNLPNLPHLRSTQVGNEKQDPMYQAIFEVYFELPTAIADFFKEDSVYLTQQVTAVQGLDVLQKTVEAGSQKFLGVDISFLNPTLDSTYAEITIDLNLNIRKVTDAWVLKVFKAWEKIGYDMSDGTRTLKEDYCTAKVRIAEANRDGSIWRSVLFHDVLLTGVTGADSLEYTNNEARKLQIKFRSDYWDEELG